MADGNCCAEYAANSKFATVDHYIKNQILELPFEILCTEQNQAKLAVAIINPILLKKYLLSIYLNATLLTVGLWCDGIPEKFFQKIDLFHN